MSDVTVTTVTPPAAAPAGPVDELAAVNAKFDALQAQLAAVLAAQQKPNVVVAAAAKTGRASLCALFTTGRAAKCAWRFLNGIKTLLFFGVSLALALAQELNGIDVTPFVQMILPEGSHVSMAQAITLMSVAGLGLRLVTNTPAFVRWTKNKFGGASDSAVDVPDEESAKG